LLLSHLIKEKITAGAPIGALIDVDAIGARVFSSQDRALSLPPSAGHPGAPSRTSRAPVVAGE
jgi:hypothetical protein